MGERRAREQRRRAREFEAFVAGAAGRLLHAATLLTGEPFASAPAARELLVGALSRTYVDWDRLRGEDPYEHTRQDLAAHFAHTARRYRRARGGLLAGLPPQERLMLVLRLYEGVAEEQVAAALGLPVERVRALCTRGMATVLSHERARRGGSPTGAVPDAESAATGIASRIVTGLRHRGAAAAGAVRHGPGAGGEPRGAA
ncbi:sigma factor-like helix-turn-helix DNA-binding protein [Streptomyces sp. WMMB 322]|uniref:sigma factor-like helix-turn-helix DNA-binding protein n=1 Tax=Streptomyces sp. WMMB 322 TaxID=1286821 RepID=UPI000823999C|nr:sigma factor-like helix-turn-helix DNA-binding protein [Streptomyces sp. WMMB 322]SCK26670.1 Sigma-70, region 4 [Streptomyces sp. WMMB 322]